MIPNQKSPDHDVVIIGFRRLSAVQVSRMGQKLVPVRELSLLLLPRNARGVHLGKSSTGSVGASPLLPAGGVSHFVDESRQSPPALTMRAEKRRKYDSAQYEQPHHQSRCGNAAAGNISRTDDGDRPGSRSSRAAPGSDGADGETTEVAPPRSREFGADRPGVAQRDRSLRERFGGARSADRRRARPAAGSDPLESRRG